LNSADTHWVEDVCEDHQHKILCASAARFYGFDIASPP